MKNYPFILKIKKKVYDPSTMKKNPSFTMEKFKYDLYNEKNILAF